MAIFCAILGVGLVLAVLYDTFATIILPRTIEGSFRLTSAFYRVAWGIFERLLPLAGKRRELYLSAFGPVSLILLIGFWAILLILGFGLVNYGAGQSFGAAAPSLGTNLYFSGVTFFTLGFGDLTPKDGIGRFMAVFEAGVGFGFLAVVISYLPVLYQSFSRREIAISLLDARAGTPPTALELIRRHVEAGDADSFLDLLKDYERWAAELLESYLSYPVLAYYRSQHEHQSWLSAMTAILDACAIASLGVRHDDRRVDAVTRQAKLTFAMARHTCVDLALILKIAPEPPTKDRLPYAELEKLLAELDLAGLSLGRAEDVHRRLAAVRAQYEPYLASLAKRMYLDIPPWRLDEAKADNWQVSAWDAHSHF